MAIISLRRRTSKKQRAMKAASAAWTVARTAIKARLAWVVGRKSAKAARKLVKARLAWIVGKKATKVAAPAVAVGTAAVVAKRSGRFDRAPHGSEDAPERPVESAPTSAAA